MTQHNEDQHPYMDKSAIDDLSAYNISGRSLYFLSLIPLIEVAWADGKIQENELKIMKKYVEERADQVNQGLGVTLLSYQDGYDFLDRFIKERPNESILKILRTMVIPITMKDQSDGQKENEKINIVKFCLDVAAASVTTYPYGDRERFCEEEKKVFLEILKTMDVSPQRIL